MKGVCAGGTATASVQEDCAEEGLKSLVGEGAGGASNGLKLFSVTCRSPAAPWTRRPRGEGSRASFRQRCEWGWAWGPGFKVVQGRGKGCEAPREGGGAAIQGGAATMRRGQHPQGGSQIATLAPCRPTWLLRPRSRQGGSSWGREEQLAGRSKARRGRTGRAGGRWGV